MPGLRMIASSLICAMAACACASLPSAPPQVIEVQAAKLPPAPAEVMVPRQASFLDRLLNFLSAKPVEPTK